MSTQRPFFRSLILALGCAALAACIVQSQPRSKTRTRTPAETTSGANPGYGDTEGAPNGDEGGDGASDTDGDPGAATVEAGVGQPCGEGDSCAEGLECMRYYGIAGANGPEFSSCEMRCDSGCPDGLGCVTIADGPGAVCRPTSTTEPTARATAAQGDKCGEGISCADGLQCIEYYGFAGPSGPKFASCEMRCGDGQACPPGQSCTTISDGPGTVCRPNDK